MLDRAYTDAELDAAVAAIADPVRLNEAQDLVLRTAPALQRVLGAALDQGGWFDHGHDQAVRQAAERDDPHARLREVRTLLAEETRLGMLVGVAVGFELARELAAAHPSPSTSATPVEHPSTSATRVEQASTSATTVEHPSTSATRVEHPSPPTTQED